MELGQHHEAVVSCDNRVGEVEGGMGGGRKGRKENSEKRNLH